MLFLRDQGSEILNPFASNRTLVQSYLRTVEVAGSNPAALTITPLQANPCHSAEAVLRIFLTRIAYTGRRETDGLSFLRHPASSLPASKGKKRFAMNAPRFVHDDIVRVVQRGQIGTVKAIHQTGNGYVYGVHLRTDAGELIDVAEEELALLKLANSDETGFSIRYIT